MGGKGLRRRAAALAAAAAAVVAPAAASAESIDIHRDRFGVPHVFAQTPEGVAYGAGYALAQDRLWQMHVFRKATKGELSDLLGPAVVETDKAVRAELYSAEERAARLATYREDIRTGLEAFARGVNAWIDTVNTDPSKMPFEFREFGVVPVPAWTVDDSLALQDYLILTFGAGGGNELSQLALLEDLEAGHGDTEGQRAFDDLVHTVNPEAPQTIPPDLKWRKTPVYADGAKVATIRRLQDDARLAPEDASTGTRAQARLVRRGVRGLARQVAAHDEALAGVFRMFKFGSNAQIVGPKRGAGQNTLQTGGPQVDYAVPQYLADIGLHGGGIEATGMTFAGVGPAVLIGRGPGYAWTTTTGSSDLSDTYVEKLNPDDPKQVLFNGEYEPMACRTEQYTVRGAPTETQEICRTRHGTVVAVDEEQGVAIARRNGWFNREGQTITGFWDFNTVRSLRDFGTAASYLSSNHNMFYVDDRGHYGYWHPGNHPQRADGVDLRLPQDGTGGSEWQGLVPIKDVPHAVDFSRSWLVNWNNSPAAGWPRERAWEANDGVQDLSQAYVDRDTPDPRGGLVNSDGAWSFEDLNANLRHAAMAEHRFTFFRSSFPSAADLPEDADVARAALVELRHWDGHRRDDNADGEYDDAALTILRAWLDELRREIFLDDLGAANLGRARIDSEVWQAVSPDAEYEQRFDWLDGRSRSEVAAAAFAKAVDALQERFENADPETWRTPVELQPYTRMDADIPRELALTTACGELEPVCALHDRSRDSGFPGDIPEHPFMDRGTYNHIVEYLDPASRDDGPLGASRSNAGSVIPPGQSGFIHAAGQESAHFEDQLPLYLDWRYKPMPLALDDVRRQAESSESIEMPN